MAEPLGGDGARCGYVAIVGAPNAGKSTLLNQLVGAKVAIVTPKVQTTRFRITAIAIEGKAELIFVDTPGIFEAKRRLERAMVQAAWAGAADADIVLLVVDAGRGLEADTRRIIEGLRDSKRTAVLALNKVDTVKRNVLLGLSAELNAQFPFAETFMISAKTGDGVADLKRRLGTMVPAGPWLYPADQLADLPERLLAAEITREQVFLKLHDELPYASTVETEAWRDMADGSVRIEQVIYVTRDSHKPIVLGKGGRTAKAIGAAARLELERILERRVHLFLFVKVRENWTEDPERYAAMGLDFPR
ncbi:MAG TPA: GTPase Era [Candidatus Cybelea sp.]|nr:GTPase Era [Candidatus Cybelea sp.]